MTPALPQHQQVTRGRRGRHPRHRRQLACTHLAVAQRMDDGHPARMAKRLEHLRLPLQRLLPRPPAFARIALRHGEIIRYFAKLAILIAAKRPSPLPDRAAAGPGLGRDALRTPRPCGLNGTRIRRRSRNARTAAGWDAAAWRWS